jgi:hypothetical protein
LANFSVFAFDLQLATALVFQTLTSCIGGLLLGLVQASSSLPTILLVGPGPILALRNRPSTLCHKTISLTPQDANASISQQLYAERNFIDSLSANGNWAPARLQT